MAIFKGKTGIEGKREVVFHGGKTIATIIGTFETLDEGLVGTLTSLGYQRIDEPPVQPPLIKLVEMVEPTSTVTDAVFDLPPIMKPKRKLGGK